MRLHVGVAMPEKGGRPAIVVAEIRENPAGKGVRRWHYRVGNVERVEDRNIEKAAEALRSLVAAVVGERPCVFVDTGSPQGVALLRVLRGGDWPAELHHPHQYRRTKADTRLFAQLLEAYAEGTSEFLPDLPHRKDLDRAMVLFRGGGARVAGDELESEDEALVIALCLAVTMPSHGIRPADVFTGVNTSA